MTYTWVRIIGQFLQSFAFQNRCRSVLDVKQNRCIGSQEYQPTLRQALTDCPAHSLSEIHSVVCGAAPSADALLKTCCPEAKPWNDGELGRLRAARRTCVEKAERRDLSKQIQILTRQQLRKWQTQRLRLQLEKFQDLKQLEKICSVQYVGRWVCSQRRMSLLLP